MCFSSPKPAPSPPPAPPAPPPVQPVALQSAQDNEGSSALKRNKGRKSLRIDLATSNVSGSSGLNLPVGQ